MLSLLPATPLCLVCRIIYSPRFLREAARCGVGGVILVQVVGCGDGFRLPSCGQGLDNTLVAVLFSGWGRVMFGLVVISFARVYGAIFRKKFDHRFDRQQRPPSILSFNSHPANSRHILSPSQHSGKSSFTWEEPPAYLKTRKYLVEGMLRVIRERYGLLSLFELTKRAWQQWIYSLFLV